MLESLELWPVFGPMRGSSTPQRQPINRRQFSVQVRGLSQRLMSPLHVHFTSFCSICLISFLPPALLCYLPHLCSPSTLSASVLLLSLRVLANLCACVRVRAQFPDSSVQMFPKQAEFLRISWNICGKIFSLRKPPKRTATKGSCTFWGVMDISSQRV